MHVLEEHDERFPSCLALEQLPHSPEELVEREFALREPDRGGHLLGRICGTVVEDRRDSLPRLLR